MENTDIKLLDETSVEIMCDAFADAFSEYEVPIEMPVHKFREMMKIRDLNPDYSLGYFVDEKLVGFIICGFRVINGKNYCYDGGTGVIKAYRRKGIGEKLLHKLKTILKEKNIAFFVLEVLENNTPAINLYQKYGFKKTRRLECFDIEKDKLKVDFSGPFQVLSEKGVLKKVEKENYRLFAPTWQNEDKSIENGGENYVFKAIESNGQIACYGFVNKIRGDVPQIGITEEQKNKGLEELLLTILAKETASDKILVLNVEEKNYLAEVLKNAGFSNFVNQYEMICEF